ncbi:MAG: hypothetical protein WC071_03480, partial [Victivallaceae bacterium]
MMTNVLHDLFIVSNIDDSRAEISFTAPEKFESIRWQALDGGKVVAQGKNTGTPGEKVEFAAKIENCKYWNINTPFLYKFSAIVAIGGKNFSTEIDFGMRTIKTQDR